MTMMMMMMMIGYIDVEYFLNFRQEARVASYSTHSGGFHAPYDRLSNK